MFGTVMTRFNPRVFGTLLIGMMSIIIIILKVMNDYEIGKNTSLYYELNGIMLSFPIFFAIAITMILHRLVIGYKTMILMFVFWLIISYLIITPIVLGGV
jgi:glucan phosphoethanolaminetransferase (alkaline phosphatase superfamily)